MTRKIAFVGATRGMGRALARRRAARGDRIFLLGRSEESLRRSAADLEQRGAPAPVGWAHLDLADPATFPEALERADRELDGFDTFVLTAAEFATQEALEHDRSRLERLLRVDFVHTILLCEEARERLLGRPGAQLVVFSSVAGDRGRGSVGLYGAAKAGLSHYLEALDSRYRRQGLVTICVKPGFVRTEMTEGLPAPPFAGDVESVARTVERAMERGRPVVYAPPVWRFVMAIVRRLPRFVLRRTRF